NVGLCLPRRTLATELARRPRTWSVASTTNQSLFKSAVFAVQVFCLLNRDPSVNHFQQCQAPRGRGSGRQAPVASPQHLANPLGRFAAASYVGQRTSDAARQAAKKALRHQLQLDEVPSPRHLG